MDVVYTYHTTLHKRKECTCTEYQFPAIRTIFQPISGVANTGKCGSGEGATARALLRVPRWLLAHEHVLVDTCIYPGLV